MTEPNVPKRLVPQSQRELTHAEMIEWLLAERAPFFPEQPVLVESGCGRSTMALAEAGARLNATVYSCDCDSAKVAELRSRAGKSIARVRFLIGESLESFGHIAAAHAAIHFLFLDSAASAMHTFREFMTVESCLEPGACLLVDNAALPSETSVLSPVRKGKILVPYVLASPFWEVYAHPRAGDSMISAVRHSEGLFADADYEHPDH